MKKRDYSSLIVLFIIVSLIGFMVWFDFYGKTHYEFLYSLCEYSGPSKIEMIQIGTVTTSDKEVCKVEEAIEIFYEYNYDEGRATQILNKKDKCWATKDLREVGRKPLVRRMICPSGLNGQSTVTDDGTKFHREVLQ